MLMGNGPVSSSASVTSGMFYTHMILHMKTTLRLCLLLETYKRLVLLNDDKGIVGGDYDHPDR